MRKESWTVEFERPSDFETSVQREIRGALRNIPLSTGASQDGHWPDGLREVRVLRRLAGGRSGSAVLEIRLLLEDGDTLLQVAKLSDRDHAVKEYRAAAPVAQPRRFPMHLDIVAASRGVLDADPANPNASGLQAVVYQHVEDRHGTRGDTRSLEEVVAQGVADEAFTESACESLRHTLTDLADQFHRAARKSSLSLGHLNGTLGTDLHLYFERIKPQDGQGVDLDLGITAPSREEVEAERCGEEDVLLSSSSPPGDKRTICSGRRVTLLLEEPALDRERLSGRIDGARVEAVAQGSARDKDLRVELKGSSPLRVSANVLHTRAELRSQLLKTKLSSFGHVEETAQELACDGVRVAHPLRELYAILHRTRDARVTGTVHGDLNPRNVLLRGDRTYLIDFADAEPDGLTLTDYAWLEVCLLRELEDSGLAWRELLVLQRQLAVMSKLFVFVDDECLDKILAALVDTGPGPLGRCLALVWEIRRAALLLERRHCSPEEAQRHLFEYLTLAALRPLKFPEEEQSPFRVAVCAATAGVAAEALRGEPVGLFSSWETDQAATLMRALLDSGQAHRPGAVDLLIGARQAAWTAGLEELDLDGALLRALFRGPLSETLDKQREHCGNPVPFIALTGRVLRPGEPFVQQGDGALAMDPRPATELLWSHERSVLVGDCGAGKSATVRELQARVIRGGIEPQYHLDSHPPLCWPLELNALRISEYLRTWRTAAEDAAEAVPGVAKPAVEQLLCECAELGDVDESVITTVLRLGGVYAVVDELHKVDAKEKPFVLGWIRDLVAAFPALRMTVCQRGGDYQPSALGWPAVVLHRVRAPQAREYIEDRIRRRDQVTWRTRVSSLQQAVFDDPEAGSLRDLAAKPLFLRILVDRYLEEEAVSTTNPGKLVEEYTRGLIAGVDDREVERRMKLLAHLAGDMDAFGAAIRYEDAVKSLERLRPFNARDSLEALLRSTAVVTDPSGRWVAFDNPVIHAYFAATFAQEEDSEKVADRILQFHWREAAQLLVANPQTPQDMVEHILRTALDANLVYGAWLLQAAPPGRFGRLRDRLLRTLTAQLEAGDSGQPAWRQAAYGFAKYGTPDALRALRTTAMDAAAPAAAEALDGLVMMHQWFVPGARKALTEIVSHLLDAQPDDVDQDLTVRAVRSIATTRLHELVGYLWDRVRADAPWPVIRQAWQALAQLNVRPSGAVRRTYTEACRRRLPETLTELSRTADATTVHQLHLEQRDILTVLAGNGDLSTLLEYRFRTGLADDITWHPLLTTAAEHCDDTGPARLLRDGEEVDWDALLDRDDDTTMVLACHMLLHRGRTLPVTRVQQLAADASPTRLLALAAFVHTLNGHEMPAVDDIVRAYTDRLDEGYLEPLSALVRAVSSHDLEARPRAALLLDEATRRPGRAPSMYWPWAPAWRESVPDRSEIDLFAQAPRLDDSEMLKLLGTTDVLLDAPPFDPVPLSEEQRSRLERLQPDDPGSLDAHRFVILAASTGLHQALSFVRAAADHPGNRTTTVVHSHPLHGVQTVVPAAHAVAAIGYLSLLAAEEHPTAGRLVSTAYKELNSMILAPDEAHPSLRRARLVGMGFLGDWTEILEGLEADDPVMHHAAWNIVMHWVPGPWTPPSEEKDPLVSVARSISERLRQSGIPSPTRAALVHIRDSAETRMGRYVR
ncbi:hypothetical protein AB0P07_10735 [Streptomyces sp. NPDC085944]|uniref:hypothetical protein n=1 Tax=Streptomyces sp. NPDC085944 TaxID=3154962 RepID=UPI00342B9B46